MDIWTYLPVHPALGDLVESIVAMDMDFSGFPDKALFSAPWSSKVRLLFTLSEEPLLLMNRLNGKFMPCAQNFVLGPRLLVDHLDFGRKRHVLSLAFRPGGLQRLTGIPVSEYTNLALECSWIFGTGIKEVENRLREAPNDAVAGQILQQYLLRLPHPQKPALPFDRALAAILSPNRNITVDHWANLACLSNRQLARYSLEKLGMSPKLFIRLTRFTQAYLLKERMPHLKWTEIAYRFGYYDQTHFIRDFKIFAEQTPKKSEQEPDDSPRYFSALEGNA